MFYLAGEKIYLAEHDGKVYPEVKLMVDPTGNFYFKKLGTGSAKKPVDRLILSKEELIARFSHLAKEETTASRKS